MGYQPSCECTILSEIPLELVYTSAIVPVGQTGNGNNPAPVAVANVVTPPASTARTYSPTELHSANFIPSQFDSKSQSFTSEGCPSESPLGQEPENNVESPTSMVGSGNNAIFQYYLQPLNAEASLIKPHNGYRQIVFPAKSELLVVLPGPTSSDYPV